MADFRAIRVVLADLTKGFPSSIDSRIPPGGRRMRLKKAVIIDGVFPVDRSIQQAITG